MSEFKDLKLSELVASSTNPRTEFEENSLNELAESIKEHGVLQPVIVRKHPTDSKKYEIVCGERRFRASTIAGAETIPVSIRELSDDEVFEIQIIENLERKDVHPLDEAKAFQKMLDSGKYTMEDIAAKVAKNLTFVAQRLKLNDLIPELQEDFLKGEFGVGHAVLLSRVSKEKQAEIFEQSKDKWEPGYGTVKHLKEELEDDDIDLSNAFFDIEDSKIYAAAGACTNCQKNSHANQVLFPEYEDNICFDKICFDTKTGVAKRGAIKTIIDENPGLVFTCRYQSKNTEAICSFVETFGKNVLTGWDSYNHSFEGNENAIRSFDLDKWDFQFITISKTNKQNSIISDDPKQNIKLEISKIKDRANRALELDREKIYKRSIDELVKDETKREVLFSMNPLSENEKKALFSTLMSYDNEKWLKELTGAKDIGYSITRADFIREHYSDELLNAVIRKHLKRELVSESLLDYKKQENPSFYFEILKDYFPKEVELFTDEQNDVAAKRIERSEKRIADLQKELADSSEKIEEAIQNNTSTKICSECNRTDVDFIQEFGYPAIWHNNSLCVPCSTKKTEDAPITTNNDIKGDPSELKKLLNQNAKTFEKISRKRFALNNSYFKFKYPEMPQTPEEVVAYFEQHQELPFDMDPETNPNWLYECTVEYQKRNGVVNSQFFTPPATAERISELAVEYFGKDEDTIVLDACCGFGMLSKPIKEKGFIVFGFDFDSAAIEMYKSYVGAVNEVEVNDFKYYNNPHSVKWSNIVSNPPYEVKDATEFLTWLNDTMDGAGAIAILLLPKGFVNKERPKALVEILEKFTVLHQEDMQEDFARTAIRAEIVVLEKN